ncbi:MAG: NADH-quinone oxidoreductase subunit N [Myxococcota bacterium]
MIGPALNWHAITAPLLLGVGAMVVLLAEVFLSSRRTLLGRPVTAPFVGSVLVLLSGFFLTLAFLSSAQVFLAGGTTVFNPQNPMLQMDRLAHFCIALLSVATLLSVFLSKRYLEVLRINHGEYYALVLLATSGMFLLVGSSDMIMLFLALEIMSIPVYVLAGFDRRRVRSNEAALKYFLMGAFASAILLYGMALLYGATGHTDFVGIRAGLGADRLSSIGLGMVLVGFAFKIAAVPFHQWAPDVYQGAPTPVTAWMSVAVKVAAFAALLRVLTEAFRSVELPVAEIFGALAVLTMAVGNLMAVVQTAVQRMLAYSSIAHVGYVLIGFATATPEAWSAVLFYLLAYVFTNLGAFGVVIALAAQGGECERIEDFAGLASTRPALAALMTLFMLSLAGIPGTIGFFAKFQLFFAAVQGGHVGLTIVAVLASAVSVYYYLRLPVVMYMHEPAERPERALASGEALALAVCALAVLVLGFFPNAPPGAFFAWLRALDWTRAALF